MGFYYGIGSDFLSPGARTPSSTTTKEDDDEDDDTAEAEEKRRKKQKKQKKKQRTDVAAGSEPSTSSDLSVSDVLSETLTEFRSTSEELRETLESIREEMAELRRQMAGLGESGVLRGDGQQQQPTPGLSSRERRRRQERYDELAREIEEWASRLLFEEGGEEDGWKEVECSKLLRSKYNPKNDIRVLLKWLPDSRTWSPDDKDDDNEDDVDDEDGSEPRLFACIRCYTTIDAPFEDVCSYLADESRMAEYNELVVEHRDVEELSPHSKICWGRCPQILFLKPRDFVTFCHHRWGRNGSQVVVNQAVNHDLSAPTSRAGMGGEKSDDEASGNGKGNGCSRAYALRGANFLSRDPADPNKTRFAILAHGDPGGNLPLWASKAAVNAVAPIEPFKLFHNIRNGVAKARSSSSSTTSSAASPVSVTGGRSSRPGGLSQLGYACFWPNGGGQIESGGGGAEPSTPNDDDE